MRQSRFYTAALEMFHGDGFQNFEKLRTSTKWALYGCDCYAYGLLALGQIDLVVEQYLSIHDIIGLVPIITEAGGHVCDWQGKPITLNTDGKIIAASNADLALEVRRCLVTQSPEVQNFNEL